MNVHISPVICQVPVSGSGGLGTGSSGGRVNRNGGHVDFGVGGYQVGTKLAYFYDYSPSGL